ncbi:MAG: YegS/Rv2252/BmrU family lipid kinase [Hyphomicrobiales bacterium]
MNVTAPRRIHLIYNPTAGQRRRGFVGNVVEGLAAAGVEILERPTSHRGHAEALAAAAVAEGAETIAVAGGDGTINEVVNGVARSPGGRDVAIGIIPCGTANVVAHEIGLAVSVRATVETLTRGTAREIRPGVVDGRLFVFSLGAGFDAQAVETVNARVKSAVGPGAYVLSALGRVVSRPPDRYTVIVDGQRFEASSVVVAKGRHYAGGYVLAPAADLAADRFEVCLFRFPTRAHMLLFGAALVAGGATRLGNATSLLAETVEIVGRDGERVQVDGDVGGTLPCRATVFPGTLRLIYPAGARPHARLASD